MRTPTPAATLYAWHRAALAGRSPTVTDDPQCGWFRTRLVRGGPWVPVVIWCDRELDERGSLASDERLRCRVGDAERDPAAVWLSVCKRPISRNQYQALRAMPAKVQEMTATHAPIRLSAGAIRP